MNAQAIQFYAPGKAKLVDMEINESLDKDQVLLKTECSLISPGTEFANLSGVTNIKNFKFPCFLGYSAVAQVVKTGSNVSEFKEGDRCLCYHSIHCNIQKMNQADLAKIEDDTLSSDEAVFAVIGCMGFQGVRRCRPELGESLMVMGLGLLGQFAVQTARLSGCFPVIALDFNKERQEIALQTGADAAFSPDDPTLKDQIMTLTRNRKCDCVVEVTGNPQALIQGLELTANFGRVALVGCSRTPTESVDFYNLAHRPGINIIGAHNMARPHHDARPGVWTMKQDMATLLRYMAAGRLNAKTLFTMKSDPLEAPEIYERLYRKDPTLLGVIFDWNNY
jgi:2-desacetyl-2-hydroxyethyl bacteriochlorophyllide A dehydrogenase